MAKIVEKEKNENCHLNIGNYLKDDIIKGLCKQLEEVTVEVQDKFLRRKLTIPLLIKTCFPIFCLHILILLILLK